MGWRMGLRKGGSVGLRMGLRSGAACGGARGAAWSRAWVRNGAAHARSGGVSWGEARGCARALRVAALGRSVVPRWGVACDYARQGGQGWRCQQERSMGLRMSAAWGCTGAQHGGAHGRSMELLTGALCCCAGVLREAAHGVCQGACMGGGAHHKLLASPSPRPSAGGYS